MKYLFTCILCAITILTASAQSGRIIRFTSAHAMFPDTARKNGHVYNNKHYPAAIHYSDSSVFVFVPNNFNLKKKINYVFWFHGWGNSIDSCLQRYNVLEQFVNAGRNAVFIFPEGPKDAPDSYGGKLEQPAVFQGLMKDVVDRLSENGVIKPVKQFDINKYDITLAGHSGAYRVISRILNGSPVNEVILFDAMYGGNDAYLQWLNDPSHRFVNIYTKDGGTFDNSHFIMNKLSDSLHVPFASVNEDAVNEQLLRANKKVFIYSLSSHSGVLTVNNNFERFLKGR